MSTGFPQLIHTLISLAALLFSLGSIGFGLYLRSRFFKETASTRLVNSLRGEISDATGDIADLRDRFSRFQKREGMRDARSASQREADILAEAERIAAQQAPEEPAGTDKVSLYRKARRVQ